MHVMGHRSAKMLSFRQASPDDWPTGEKPTFRMTRPTLQSSTSPTMSSRNKKQSAASAAASSAARFFRTVSPTRTSPTRSAPPSPAERRLARRTVRDTGLTRTPRLSRPSRIVADGAELVDVLSHVPARFRECDLQAVYSTMVDGVALGTLYSAVAGSDPVLLLIRDAGDATFGVYTSVPFRADAHYHGSGEGFVFALRPKMAVFPWTRKNAFFQLGSAESVAIGGGGSFAIFLDSMLERGSSGESDTYGNKCLASTDQFDVVVVEAYKLVVPSRLSVGE